MALANLYLARRLLREVAACPPQKLMQNGRESGLKTAGVVYSSGGRKSLRREGPVVQSFLRWVYFSIPPRPVMLTTFAQPLKPVMAKEIALRLNDVGGAIALPHAVIPRQGR